MEIWWDNHAKDQSTRLISYGPNITRTDGKKGNLIPTDTNHETTESETNVGTHSVPYLIVLGYHPSSFSSLEKGYKRYPKCKLYSVPAKSFHPMLTDVTWSFIASDSQRFRRFEFLSNVCLKVTTLRLLNSDLNAVSSSLDYIRFTNGWDRWSNCLIFSNFFG